MLARADGFGEIVAQSRVNAGKCSGVCDSWIGGDEFLKRRVCFTFIPVGKENGDMHSAVEEAHAVSSFWTITHGSPNAPTVKVIRPHLNGAGVKAKSNVNSKRPGTAELPASRGCRMNVGLCNY